MSVFAKPLFITFEGIEGSGKSTQSKRLYDALISMGERVIHTREPGGTPEAEEIRKDLLGGKYRDGGPFIEAMMFSVARLYHVNDVILTALQNGCSVICDRFSDSTFAYQTASHILQVTKTISGESRPDPTADSTRIIAQRFMESLNKLNHAVLGGFNPDFTVYLNLPVERIQERIAHRVKDRFEQEDVLFHSLVKMVYERETVLYSRTISFNATLPMDELEGHIFDAIEDRFGTYQTPIPETI